MVWQNEMVDALVMVLGLYFSHKNVKYEEVQDYIKSISIHDDLNKNLIEIIYNKYIETISETNTILNIKLSDQLN